MQLTSMQFDAAAKRCSGFFPAAASFLRRLSAALDKALALGAALGTGAGGATEAGGAAPKRQV